MTWSEYVKRTMGSDQQNVAAQKAGVDQATVSRWVRTGAPGKAESVAAFARAYGRPVLEAFVVAGFLTPEEAGERPAGRPDLTRLSNSEVLALVRVRMRDEAPSPPLSTARALSLDEEEVAAFREELIRQRRASLGQSVDDLPDAGGGTA